MQHASRGSRGMRIGALTVASVVSGALLAGCGGSGGGSDSGSSSAKAADQSPASAVQAANARTTAARTATMDMKTEIKAGGKSQTMTGHGGIDLKGGNSALTLNLMGQQLHERVVDKVLYQQPPKGQTMGLPKGKTWWKIDLAKLQSQFTGGQNGMSDPAQSLAYTKSLDGKGAKKVGTETIDGVKTTHYRVKLDLAKLAGGDSAKEKQLRQQLGDSVPMDVWLDGKDRLRRIVTDMSVNAPANGSQEKGSGSKLSVRSTVNLSDFGRKVAVTAPPADQVADMTAKLGKAAKGASGATSTSAD